MTDIHILQAGRSSGSRLRRGWTMAVMAVMAVLATALGSMLLPGLGPTAAQAQVRGDPYRWCADFGGRGGGGTSCYYTSFEQCRRELIGRGGFCRPNPFYTGARGTTRSHGRYHRRDY